MPYQHRQDTLEQVQNAPEHTDFNHLKVHDLHEHPEAAQSEHLISAIVELKAGEPLPAKYPGPTVGYLIEGKLHGEDQTKPGEIFTLTQGDVIHLDSGAHIHWTTVGTIKALVVTYAPTSYKSIGDTVVSK